MAVDPMDRDPNLYNRENEVYDREARGSNTLAYLIGGLVIALGLLAFLFYDGGNRDVSTTGSTTAPQTQTEPAAPSSPNSGSTTAPAAPASPAAPSTGSPAPKP
jgi:3-oxoacyl-[acyl-carrier protein] reductase